MENITNYGQLKAYLEEQTIGKEIGTDAWRVFWKFKEILEQVDKRFSIRKPPYTKSREHYRRIYFDEVDLGCIEYKATKDGVIKKIDMYVGDMNLSWFDAVNKENERKTNEEAKDSEILAEHGFSSLDDLIEYLQRLSSSKKQTIRNRTY